MTVYTNFYLYSHRCVTVTAIGDCGADLLAKAKEDNACGYFTSEKSPFRECLDQLDWEAKVQPIYKGCLEDVCADKTAERACESLASLHLLCTDMGIYPEWRTQEFCGE